jgi:hypothetical protein
VIGLAAFVLALAIPMMVTHTVFVRKIRNKPSVLLFDGEPCVSGGAISLPRAARALQAV